MGKPKIPGLTELIGQGDAPVSIRTDVQSQQFQDLTTELRATRDLLMREVLFDLTEDDKTRYIERLLIKHAEVVDHWRKAEKHYVGAGKALLAISREIPNCSLERLLNSFDRNREAGSNADSALPFSRSTAWRLIAVARMIEERRFHTAFEEAGKQFEETMLPPYSVTCMLTTLDDEGMVLAVESDIIRPTATRDQVAKFLASRKETATPSAPEQGALRRNLGKIDRRLGKLYADTAELRRQRSEILAKLGVIEVDDEVGVRGTRFTGETAGTRFTGETPGHASPVHRIGTQLRDGLDDKGSIPNPAVGEGTASIGDQERPPSAETRRADAA